MSEIHIDLLNAFENLKQSLCHLCDAIRAEPELISWCHPSSLLDVATTNAREQTCAVLSQLHYLDHQAPREILICPGFIGASPSTLKLAMQVNECKEVFKSCVLTLKKEVKISLKQLGLQRIHLKQCYRKIPLLEQVPHKITWTWAHTKSIKKISIKQAQDLLLKKGQDVGIEIQLQKLNQLREHEHLAIIQELAPHLRANLVFKRHGEVIRKMIKGPIPIFFPSDKTTTYPDFKPPSEKQLKSEARSKRNDVKIESEVYLPAIRAHRYETA